MILVGLSVIALFVVALVAMARPQRGVCAWCGATCELGFSGMFECGCGNAWYPR